ncbi:MAG TPA: hypothetical protein VFY42_06665 [Gemmatimonadales bacterium]|nr:hypothetical protein [Gemmatimonadales bacterium]
MSSKMELVALSRGFTTMAVLALAGTPELGAQVGLSSGTAQVALVAHIAPQAAIHEVSPTLASTRDGTTNDVSVSVRISANTGYRLVVVGTIPAAGSRLWVRGMDGEFQELTAGSAVTVARDLRGAGECEREVTYRTETSASRGSTNGLPVRYEIRIEPAI